MEVNLGSEKGIIEMAEQSPPQPEPPQPARIIYLTMVKNESRIIERSMRAANDFIDAFVVCDTGSTDNTRELAQNFIEKSGKPGAITESIWKNFGHNRTISFMACRQFAERLGWDLKKTYCLLLDGDMVFRWTAEFSKDLLLREDAAAGYSIIQKAGSLHYYNARLLRLSDNWTCVGATHEYWSGPGTKNLPVSAIWIDDLNDGGSKSDKFVRDARLLEEERDADPNNGRTWFYLAQTYKDLGRLDDAIKAYERRIQIGGWVEEVWFSHYMIAKLYFMKRDFEMGEMWALKGIEFHKTRAEIHYLLTRVFREKGDHYKAWHYMVKGRQIPMPNDVLFVETNVYKGMFLYEASIIHYYCFPGQRRDGLRLSLEYLNGGLNENKDNVWDNLPFYIERLGAKRLLEDVADCGLDMENGVWNIGSCSGVWIGKEFLVNIRHSNYVCSEKGDYSSRDADGIVRTKNAWQCIWPKSLSGRKESATSYMTDSTELPEFETHIRGLEDMRLWYDAGTGEVRFTAAAMDRVPEKRYRIVEGRYNWKENRLEDGRILVPPTETSCEKNWIQIDRDRFVYGWAPLIVCNGSGKVLHRTEAGGLPWIFSKLRGSAGPVSLGGAAGAAGKELMFLCHSVHHTRPRKYLHYLVVLDSTSYKVLRWSLPFSFTGAAIEYCLTMVADTPGDATWIRFAVSRFDKDPVWIRAKLAKDFVFVTV